MAARWLLGLVAARAVDFESVFFEGSVSVERLIDYDDGHEFLEISSSGLPQHRCRLSAALSMDGSALERESARARARSLFVSFFLSGAPRPGSLGMTGAFWRRRWR